MRMVPSVNNVGLSSVMCSGFRSACCVIVRDARPLSSRLAVTISSSSSLGGPQVTQLRVGYDKHAAGLFPQIVLANAQ